MSKRLALSLALLLAFTPSMAQVKLYTDMDAAREAHRYEQSLKTLERGSGDAGQLRSAAEKLAAQGTDHRATAQAFAQAAAAEPSDARSWLGLARALLATPVDRTSAERFELPARATGAAYLAYQRGATASDKAAALGLLADAFKRRSMWRPALEALKASLALQPDRTVQATYDVLRAERGFRMTTYKIDSDSASPRLCLEFSERLVGKDTDTAKFVLLDGRMPQSVSVEDRQLCIDGIAHGKRYEVTVRAGLPSAIPEESLQKAVELAVYVRDRGSSVRMTGNTYVLPSRGQAGIPIVSVNVERVGVEIYRIGDRNLVGTVAAGELRERLTSQKASEIATKQGQRVWRGEMPVKSRLNEDVTTAFPVSDAVSKLESGVYAIVARPRIGDGTEQAAAAGEGGEAENDDGPRNRVASQWFIVSDLGVTAFNSPDGVHAFVRSLATTEPQRGVDVRLVARNNEILARGRTDERGYVRFDAGLAKGEGGQRPAVLVAEREGADYAFLDLTAAPFDLTDRGVAGRPVPGPLEAYVFVERGVYRPGESVHLTAVVRDAAVKAPALIPLTLVLTRPDGVEHKRQQLEDQGFGGRAVSLALSKTVMTGTWRARLHADPKAAPIGETTFLVEDFQPERLDLVLEAKSKALAADKPGSISVKGRYLYGPPAANLALEGEVLVRARAAGLDGFPGYVFGQSDESVLLKRRQLDALPRTDASGAATLEVPLPELPQTARPLEARIVTRLMEPGGRSVERSLTLAVATTGTRIGVKPLFDAKTIGDGQEAGFEIVLVGADGARVQSGAIRWELQRIESRWQWYNRDGAWNYEAIKLGRRVANGELKIAGEAPVRLSQQLASGRYKLELTSADASIPVTSLTFTAGWFAAGDLDTPEMLDIALDKASYKAGDTARVTIDARGKGRALVAVLGRGLALTREVEVAGKSTEVAFPVDESWSPGAYVAAIMYRPMDEAARRMPGRSIGLKWLETDKASRTLGVTLTAPEKVASGAKLTIPVRITGARSGSEARVVVSAVDLGILNLTRYEAPSPEKHFLAQRLLSSEIRDLYGRLIDGMQADRGRIRSGGDGGGGMAIEGSTQAETSLALFSGVVTPGPDGIARVTFDLPQFNGTARLTAVAWSADKVGSAKADVIVRDPVAVTVTAPRFLTLGDEARMTVDVHNVEGQAGGYKVAVDAGSSNIGGRELQLSANERKPALVTLKASVLGKTSYAVRVTGPGGVDVARTIELDVKPPAGEVRRVTVSTLKARGGRLTLTPDLMTDMLTAKAKVAVTIGPAAALDVAGLVVALDRYPYGCAEQTTSKAMPLVYLDEVAKLAGLGRQEDVKERVTKAIARLLEMQDNTGAFGIWGAGGNDMWLTAYVTDFLTRAKEAGYPIPPRPFTQALDRLRNTVSSYADFEKGGEDLAYALYVLARNGRAPVGDLRYYADTRIDRFATPLARTQIGAALAMLGDRERADRSFASTTRMLDGKETETYRSDYGSMLRDGAAMLTLVSETGMAKAEAPRLAALVERALATRDHTSTQENAWMLLAARSMIEAGARMRLEVAGKAHQGHFARTYGRDDLGSGVAIANPGDEDVRAVVTVSGDAATPEPPVSKGFSIERLYYTLDGKPVDLASATGGDAKLVQNQRLVVVLKVTPAEGMEGRLLIVDRLPAGLEIENPRLLDSASAKSIPWLSGALTSEHAEFRDDRFVAAVSPHGENAKKPIALAYTVRAISPGRYLHPAATVEDMYRPQRFARTASGRLEVTAKE